MKQMSMDNVFVGGFVAGSIAFARNPASACTCRAMSAGSETFQSIGVPPGRKESDTRNWWSVIPDWWPGPESSEDDSDDSDEMTPGMSPSPVDQAFPSPTWTICEENGLGSVNGLGRAILDPGAGV